MYTIERQDLDHPHMVWQPIEGSWEMPNQLDLLESAESAARTLALRCDGNAAFRVVDPAGSVHLVVQVMKYLRVYRPNSSIPLVPELIPPGFTVPMVSQVLEDAATRARVFLFSMLPTELRHELPARGKRR